MTFFAKFLVTFCCLTIIDCQLGSFHIPGGGGFQGGFNGRPSGRPGGRPERPSRPSFNPNNFGGNDPISFGGGGGGFPSRPGSGSGFGRPSSGFGRPSSGSGRPSSGSGRPSSGSGRPVSSGNQSPRPTRPTGGGDGKKGCNCLDKSGCPQGFGQQSHECMTERGQRGICCIEQRVLTRLGFSSSGNRPVTLSSSEADRAFSVGTSELKTLLSDQQKRKREGKFIKKGTPARAHHSFFQRSANSRRLHETAYAQAMAAQSVAKGQSLTPDEAFFSIPQARIKPSRTFQEVCPARRTPRCDASSKFRTIDGTCNNLRRPLLGQSETAFGRLGTPLYEDGIMEPRETAVDGNKLPNPRDASNTILLDVDSPSNDLALGVMQFSQFVDHDITLAPHIDMEGEAISCCEDGRLVNPQPEGCLPITIPFDDRFFAPRRQSCLNFVRSMLAPREDCTLGPVEQLNVLTHWLDGSMIYGSTQEEFDNVADPSTGLMRMSSNELPPINRTIDCEARIEGSPCFAGGDSRITEQAGLTVMHTLWIREHNKIANALFRINPHWNARRVFEEARRIVIAELQHIMYNEWLPIIIGPSNVRRLGIGTLRSGFRNSYNPSEEPTISNEFATAAFRYGHSMIQGIFKVLSATGRSSSLRLREIFNAPFVLMRDPSLVDGFVRSFTTQSNQGMDSFITTEVSNHLFQTPEFDFGLDLMALNLQRGRDHAISTYSQMRQFAGLGKPDSFFDLASTTPSDRIQRLQAVYRNVDDIDLFSGGITESPVRDGVLGHTFAAIVGTEFQRLQTSDRFFYDNGGQAGSFTPAQLNEIRKFTLAKLYCDNTDTIDQMQPDAFRLPSRGNSPRSCRDIPGVNLEAWREGGGGRGGRF